VQASSELEGIIRNWFDSVVRGDSSWLDRHLSTDPQLRIVGTDPDEWLQGQAAGDLLRSDIANLAGNATVTVQEAEAFEEGDTGWGVARFTIHLGPDMAISPRWSAVFHREDGAWKAVQVHASVGISNEQAFGMQPGS
jgi:hypothetical protein